jgi:hypothetical protein
MASYLAISPTPDRQATTASCHIFPMYSHIILPADANLQKVKERCLCARHEWI